MNTNTNRTAVSAHQRLMAALAERDALDAAIESASSRIAAGFSTEAAAQDEVRIRMVRLSTWGE